MDFEKNLSPDPNKTINNSKSLYKKSIVALFVEKRNTIPIYSVLKREFKAGLLGERIQP